MAITTVSEYRQVERTSFTFGRYRLSRRKQIIEEYFDTAPWDDNWSQRYNIAPTQPVPMIRQHGSTIIFGRGPQSSVS
jgi:putative SOS response-associated peptidase YedK